MSQKYYYFQSSFRLIHTYPFLFFLLLPVIFRMIAESSSPESSPDRGKIFSTHNPIKNLGSHLVADKSIVAARDPGPGFGEEIEIEDDDEVHKTIKNIL